MSYIGPLPLVWFVLDRDYDNDTAGVSQAYTDEADARAYLLRVGQALEDESLDHGDGLVHAEHHHKTGEIICFEWHERRTLELLSTPLLSSGCEA